MKHGLFRWIAVGVMLCGLAGMTAFAGEEVAVVEEEVVTLPEVMVTAMRSERILPEVPYTGYVLDRETMQDQMPRTTPDVFRGLPSVLLQKTSEGQGSPYLRGFTGFRTVMLVDGIRLNNSVFREGPNQYWNTVDPWSIDRYEVVMGPGSVLYGSDAVGGVVNAMSASPMPWSGQAVVEPRMGFRAATADESVQVRLGAAGRVSERLSFSGGLTWKTFGDLEGGKEVGKQKHTGYDETDFDLRVDYILKEEITLTLAHQQVEQEDAWRTHKTIYGIEWEGVEHGSELKRSFDQDRTLTYARLAAAPLTGPVDAWRLTLSRQEQTEDRYRLRTDDRTDRQGFEVVTWGVSLEMESESDWGDWVYGMEYYRDDVDSYRNKTGADGVTKTSIQGPVADEASYDLLGLYVQDTISTCDGAIEWTPGLRYTWAGLDADRVEDPVTGEVTSRNDQWDSVSASLRMLAPLGATGGHAVFAGLSQGFRAPNLSDLTRLDSARSSEIETPVEDLDPEKFLCAETGLRVQGERCFAAASVYYTWINDMIVRTPTGVMMDELEEVTKQNAGDGWIGGVELVLGVDLTEDWHTRLSGSWMEGKVDTYPTSEPVQVREYMSRLMPLTGQARLRWQPVGEPFWLEGVVDAAAKADRLSSRDKRDTQRIPPGGTPGYVVGTLRGGLTVMESMQLTLALENLTDEDYRIHGSGVNEAGRSVVVQAEWMF
jgi:outer membrane receptor protein involved in Fe transport